MKIGDQDVSGDRQRLFKVSGTCVGGAAKGGQSRSLEGRLLCLRSPLQDAREASKPLRSFGHPLSAMKCPSVLPLVTSYQHFCRQT